jgi:broad specificity phosphatase PhoE
MARWVGGEHETEYRESWSAFRERCRAALTRLTENAGASQRIIVFTSGGTIATLCQMVLGMTDAQVMQLNWSLVNSAVTKLLYQPGRVGISYLNNYAHLEWLGEAHAVTYR